MPDPTVDPESFDPDHAWTLWDAIRSGKLSWRGFTPSRSQVQRWANPKRGIRPIPDGPTLVLPTIRTPTGLLTMPQWVDAFVARRRDLLLEHARKMSVPIESSRKIQWRASYAKRQFEVA